MIVGRHWLLNSHVVYANEAELNTVQFNALDRSHESSVLIEAINTTSEPYAKVESLYGPGTIGAWLLSLFAIFISWTFHAKRRREDSLSIDVLLAVALPAVAASHLFYLVNQLPEGVAKVLTTNDGAMIQWAAAIEAPLNVCETFSVASLALAACCGPWHNSKCKLKRAVLIITTGLLSFMTEEYLFEVATKKGVRARDVVLSRAYMFLCSEFMITVWTFLAALAFLIVVFYLHQFAAWLRRRKAMEIHQRSGRTWPIRSDDTADAVAEAGGTLANAVDTVTVVLMCISIAILIIFVPLSGGGVLITVKMFRTKAQESNAVSRPKMSYFVPNSSTKLGDLDQGLALATGIMVLLFSCGSAWQSWRKRWATDQSREN